MVETILSSPPKFGELLRRLRKAKGMTLQALADKIGSHKGYISAMENAKSNPPTAIVIARLSRALGYDSKKLLLLAYVDRAPETIREELRKRVYGEGE